MANHSDFALDWVECLSITIVAMDWDAWEVLECKLLVAYGFGLAILPPPGFTKPRISKYSPAVSIPYLLNVASSFRPGLTMVRLVLSAMP